MKITTITLGLVFFFFSPGMIAQQANEILGIAKETKTADYYNQQTTLWKQKTDKNPKDGYAWYQYYKAKRAYLQKHDPQQWASDQTKVFEQLRPIITSAKRHIAQSADYYLMEAANTREKVSVEYYQKAFEIDPDRVDSYEGLFVHYVSTFNDEKAGEIARKMLAHNYYANANLKWNYNALVTADEQGVFITHGDMDAIPRWVLQFGKGIRKDVLVISKWTLANDVDYKKRILKKLGLKDMNKSQKDYADVSQYVDDLSTHILVNSPRTVYMGCGTNIDFFKKAGVMDDIYLVGTAFVYSKESIDNMAITEYNFENKYDLEYLLNNFQTHPEDEMVKKYMNVTYIPGLMKLKKHYEKTNKMERAKKYSELIMNIAEESERKDEILSWF